MVYVFPVTEENKKPNNTPREPAGVIVVLVYDNVNENVNNAADGIKGQ